MTIKLPGPAFPSNCTIRQRALLATLPLFLLGMASTPILAGGWKGGPHHGASQERAAGTNASPAQGIGIGGGRLLFGLGLLRDLIGNIARGGPGEGATPHISPTTDWKGQVNTNICNFQHICQ